MPDMQGMPTGKSMPPMGVPPGMAPVPPMGPPSFGPQGPGSNSMTPFAFGANGPNGPFDLADFLNTVVGAAESGFPPGAPVPPGPPMPPGPYFLPGPPVPPGPEPKNFNGPQGFGGPQSGPQGFGGPFDGPFGGPHDFGAEEEVQDYTDSVDDYSGSQDYTQDYTQDTQDYTEEYSGSEENNLPQKIGGAEARSGMVELQGSSSSGNTWIFASTSDSASVNGPAGPQGPQGPMGGNGPSQGGWNFRNFNTNQQGPQGNSWSFPSPGGPPSPPRFGPAGKPQGPFPPAFPGGSDPSDQQLLITLLTDKLAEEEQQLSTEEAQGSF